MALESAFVGTTKDNFIEFGELKEVCEDVIILIKSSRWRLLTLMGDNINGKQYKVVQV